MRKHLLPLILFLSGWLELPAQPSHSAFIHYTTDQGLSNDFVKDIVKDRQGFIWVATLHGLNRFDGYTFHKFLCNPAEPDGLPDSYIRFLTLGPDGSLWTSGEKGICRVDPVRLTFRKFALPENEDTLENDATGKVVFDELGRGWVSAETKLYSFDPLSGHIEAHPVDKRKAGHHSTYIDRTGRIWLVNDAVVSYFEIKTGRLRTLATDTPGNPLTGSAPLFLHEDQHGKIWVSTWFKGLAWYDPALDSLLDYPDENSLATVMLPDRNAEGKTILWLGGGHYGLYTICPDTGEAFHFPPDPRDPYTHNHYIATSFLKDETDGSLWIGTEAGLQHYAPSAVRFGRVILPVDLRFGQFSLMSDVIRDRTDPSGNTYYIAMWGSGFFKWDRRNNRFKQLHKENSGLRNDMIFCAMQDRRGFIWAGSEGVSRLDPRTGNWRSWDTYSGKLGYNVMVMSCIEDNDGRLWFGTNRGGLFHYDPATDRMEEICLPDEAYDGDRLRIGNMSLDRQGKIWLATLTRPVRFDPRTRDAEVFHIKNSKQNYNQWSDVIVGRNGRVYATSHDCILEMDSACTVLRQFDQQNGLLSNQVYYIEEDRRGRIWCNTNHLLHCLDPETGSFTYYGTGDGLFKNTITDGLKVLPDGELFIGFQNAFNYVHPSRLRRNPAPPPVVITSMKVMDRERQVTTWQPSFLQGAITSRSKRSSRDTSLVIRPGEKIFTIEFAALNFNQPTRNRYAYKLEGFNEDWVYTDLNFATYTNIEGGEYLFRVKAANNDGVWNEKGARVWIKVIPVLTRRWYFQLSMLMLMGLILLGIAYYRRRQRQRLEIFRERLARDLHDEMGSTLSSIRFFSEYARQQTGKEKPEVDSILQRISQSASALSESMQDIVWAMKAKNDHLEDLSTHMTEFGLRMLEANNITFKTHIGEGFSGRHLKPEVRRNLYLIFKEAVNNASKYAVAGEVELFLAIKKGLLIMKVSDDGCGFVKEAAPEGSGNGLQNMQQRAEEIGGEVDIASEKGRGTVVRVRVRI